MLELKDQMALRNKVENMKIDYRKEIYISISLR